MKLKLTFKIWMLIIFVAFSLIAIFGIPPQAMQSGVKITSINQNSSAFNSGLREGQIIQKINGKDIETLSDFSQAILDAFPSENLTEPKKLIIDTTSGQFIYFSEHIPEITVSDIPNTKIKFGLDLVGGSKALVKAKDKKLSKEEVLDLVEITRNRLNVYGITDLTVKPVSDLSGNNFMLIEIAGATPGDLKELISEQGKFEAKIGNETVFVGGERDISSVCRNDATCAGIRACEPTGAGYQCQFSFSIYLSENAANRQADATRNLTINSTNPRYLSKKLDLYLDDKPVDSLFIGKDLKGRVTTQIQISGAGTGETQDDAYKDAEASMHKLQTILITGSLPYKLEVVKLDTISPSLGDEFLRLIMLSGLAAIFAAALIIFVRYRKIKSSLAIILTSLSEIIIILGVAALIDWNLDLPSIAGIIATIGTGMDDLIIVLDEAKQKTFLSIKQKMKRAFAIILGTYFTTVVSLIPLYWAGAGLLKGFAITTIIGISVGVLITRPAFTDIIRLMEYKD